MGFGPSSRPPVAPFLAAAVALVGLIVGTLPDRLFPQPVSLVVEDRRGGLLAAAIASDGQWRLEGVGALPDHYVRALVLSEDKRFFSHVGVDVWALARALGQNLSQGQVVSGGSTITMQVLRMARQGRDRSLGDKMAEAWGAWVLELRTNKQGILRLYADHAPFGGNVVGIEAAAWRYFGHPSATVSWAEACLLAVLPNNPGYLRTDRGTFALKTKRDRLLARLNDAGQLDAETLQAALAEPLPEAPLPLPQTAPHLLSRLASEGARGRVRTTVDGTLQDRMREIVQKRLDWLSGNAIENMAVVVAKTRTGEVLAYVGNGEGAIPGGSNDMVARPRSTGSLLKPFLYARMVQTGELLPHQLVEDVPTRIAGFVPRNNVNTYSGLLPAAEALARSLNVPAARELRTYGVTRFVQDLKDFGLTGLWRVPEDYGLPLILGGAEASLWDLVGAYTGLGRTALGTSASFFPLHVRGTQPKVPQPGPVLSPGAAYLALDAMKEVVRPDEETGWRLFAGARRVAWKTGTSSSYKDAWAIGVTPEYTVGVWVGNADGVGRPDLLGLRVAAPVLFEVFHRLPDTSWFSPPWADMKAVDVCRESGYLASDLCPDPVTEWIPKDAQPTQVCPYHQDLLLSPDRRYRVDSRVVPVSQIVHQVWFVVPPSVEPFYRATRAGYRSPPPWDPRIAPWESKAILLTVPTAENRLIIPVDLDGSPGQLLAQAYHQDPGATLYWSLDGEYLGQTQRDHSLAFRPSAGHHVLALVDDHGRQLNREFDVLAASVTERYNAKQR